MYIVCAFENANIEVAQSCNINNIKRINNEMNNINYSYLPPRSALVQYNRTEKSNNDIKHTQRVNIRDAVVVPI